MMTHGRSTSRTAAMTLALSALGLAVWRSVDAAPVQQKRKVVAKAAAPATFTKSVKPVFAKYCTPCHGKTDPSAGLNLEKYLSEATATKDLAIIEKSVGRMLSGEMPPGGPKPSAAEKKAAQMWVESALNAQCKLADPGRVTLRRLNREEYNNTVRDLLGTSLRPADDFPGDDVGNGFDNMGDVLSLSPLLMEKLLDSAERLARETIVVPKISTRRIDVGDMKGPSSSPMESGGMMLASSGVAIKEIKIATGGNYKLKIQAWGQMAGPEPPKMAVRINDQVIQNFTVMNPKGRSFEMPINLGTGVHRVGIEFTNDYYDERSKADRNLVVDFLEVTGPLKATAFPAAHRRIVPFEPDKGKEEATARQFITDFATRAFRRPPTPDDIERLMAVWNAGNKGGTFNEGMRLAVQACLSSPRFIFRLEQDPPGAANKVRTLDSYEVASRLSYFIWSSMPDDELLQLAKFGKLTQPAVLKAQVTRMLADSRAHALADNFAGQWLQLRKLAIVEPDPERFPGIDTNLKHDMATETKQFFLNVLQNGRPITDFIDGKYTFLNERLAKHYGIPGVNGNEFRKIALTGDRGGVLTQASVLTVTSNPTRTSPTKRGKWVLENILGTPPPPPPPGVGDIADEKHKIEATTLRKLMEEHRKNPTCASCHQRMDPIGFGMENYDPVGRWRTMEGKFPVDSSGSLPGGVNFRGPSELKQILLKDKVKFAHALSEKLLTYALGRGLDATDRCALDGMVAQATKSGLRLDSLVTATVLSDPFLKRKGTAK